MSKFTLDEICNLIKDTITYNDQQVRFIVSVGLGIGKYERVIQKIINYEIICVDLSPFSYRNVCPAIDNTNIMNELCLSYSTYGNIHDFIQYNPDAVNNSALLIIWPRENSEHDPQKPYDTEAIKLLNPKSIFCLYEQPKDWVSGVSGSQKLIEFFDDTKNNKTEYYIHQYETRIFTHENTQMAKNQKYEFHAIILKKKIQLKQNVIVKDTPMYYNMDFC